MSDRIQHECTISWGMTYGDDGWVEKLIEKTKLEVALALERAGFEIIDQHFVYDVEWGTLITWAKLVQDPKTKWMRMGDRECQFGYFYDEDKQLGFLLSKKVNKDK